MEKQEILDLLRQVQQGQTDAEKAFAQLKNLPFENLGFARIDHHRCLRSGVPEVIYCEGKRVEQTAEIARKLAQHHSNILATRADPAMYKGIQKAIADCEYHEAARIVVIRPQKREKKGNIAVVTAGTSDIPVAEEAAVTAETLGNHVNRIYDAGVAGIHRILSVREELFRANVAVVVAGMEGALASVVGGLVSCPVIGVPTSIGYGASFGGLSALLCMLNSCASGVSVVNIDNGFGAGYQAALINQLAVGESGNAGNRAEEIQNGRGK
ncbi:MAG: nickel pincer cofactor biosynthesis protein LarB [Desulfococcaceae bacterium]|jgi:NCAIR mutase (PurE)-related protein|nr:nickel pincer cofactor biosynthesis protein LarB [Desulfococcaceae bacterium]